jgi:hypothetical protein
LFVIEIMFPSQVLTCLLLLNIVCGSYETPYSRRKLYQLLKNHPPEYDNRYVWFTRNIHNEIKRTVNREEQKQQLDQVKNTNNVFYRKHSVVKFDKILTL